MQIDEIMFIKLNAQGMYFVYSYWEHQKQQLTCYYNNTHPSLLQFLPSVLLTAAAIQFIINLEYDRIHGFLLNYCRTFPWKQDYSSK